MLYEKDKIVKIINFLNNKEASIIENIYGINGKDKLSKQEIIVKYDVSDMELSFLINKIEYMLENIEDIQDDDFKALDNEKNKLQQNNYKERNNKWLYEYLVEGKQDAYNKLVENNINLVYHLVKKYCSGYDYDEFVSVGSMGLLKAIDTFKKEKIGQANFSLYASIIIKNEIFRVFRNLKKESNISYFSDSIMGDDEDITLEDTLSNDENILDEYVEKEDSINKKKKIGEILKLLNKEERIVLKCLYGFGGKKPMAQKEIAEILGFSQPQISKFINSLQDKLKELLIEYKDEYSVKPVDNNTKRMNKTFYNFFNNVNKEEVLYLLSQFGDKEYVILYYGLDGENCLDYDEIAVKFGVSVDKVDMKIEKIITALKNFYVQTDETKKFTKINRYRKLIEEYGIYRVNEAMEKLSKLDRKLILSYYLFDLNSKSLLSKYPAKQLYGKINSIIMSLTDFLENPNKVSKRRKINEDKFNFLVEKYGKDKVNKAIKSLGKNGQKVIGLYYGLDGNGKRDYENIAKLLNITIKNSYDSLRKNLIILENKLMDFNMEKDELIKLKFSDLINFHGKEEVLYLLNQFEDKEYVSLYYGLDGCKRLGFDEIAIKFGVTVDDVKIRIQKTLTCIKRFYLKQDLTSSYKKINRYRKLIKEYGVNKVNTAMNKLSKLDRDIILDYYLFDLSLKDLLEKYDLKNTTGKVHRIIDSLIEFIEKPDKISVSRKINEDKFNLLIEEYGNDKVMIAIRLLGEIGEKVITSYYGLDGKGKREYEEISELLGIESKKLWRLLEGKLKSLKNNLKNFDNEKEEVIKARFKSLIDCYGIEEILKVLERFNDKDKKIIFMFFGLCGEKEKNFNEINYILKCKDCLLALDKILNKLEEKVSFTKKSNKPDKIKDSLDKLIENYGEERIKKAMSKLENECEEVFSSYYELYKKNHLNNVYRKLNEKYNISRSYDSINHSLKRLEFILSKPEDKKLKGDVAKEEFNKLIEEYGKETVLEQLSKLNKKDRVIISLYLGLGGNKSMSLSEIRKILNIDIESYKIHNTLRALKRHLKNPSIKRSFLMFEQYFDKFGDKKIINEINRLGLYSKNAICMYYGLQGKEKKSGIEIGELIGVHRSNIFNLIKTFNEYLDVKLNNSKGDILYFESRFKKLEVILRGLKTGENSKKFVELVDSFGIKEVEKSVSILDEKQQKIINLYFGLNGNQIIGKDEMVKHLGNNISMYVRKSLDKMNDYLLNNQKKIEVIKEKKKHFKSLLVVKEEKKVKDAINQLSDKEKIILYLYFGLNGKDILTAEELCDKLGINEDILREKLKDIIDKLNKIIVNKFKK